MTLLDALISAVIVFGSANASVQIWGNSRSALATWQQKLGQLEAMDQDRLQLSAAWRQSLASGVPCSLSLIWMRDEAAAQSPPPGLQRELKEQPDGETLKLRWRSNQEPDLTRERLISPAALGLCQPASPPAAGEQS